MTSKRQAALAQAATTIRAATRIAVASHVRPDADALGSLLGLTLGLRALGKEVEALSADGVPAAYRFLPGWESVRTSGQPPYDLGIGLDCDGSDRMGAVEPVLLGAATVIDIDHHTGPDRFGQLQVVDPTAAATGELVYGLLQELGIPITSEIATNLLAAILTDTGSYRFSNVTSETFRISAELVEAGAHPAPIHEAVYGSRSYAASKLLGVLLENLSHSPDGRVVWAALPQSAFQRLGLGTEATEGFVDQVRMVEGSEVALFLREEAGGEIRVSLRSRGHVNVAKVAEEFGGGGHVPAAGCTLQGPLDQAVERVVSAVYRVIGGP